MAEKFLNGELPLDSFIDVYQSKRKLAHMRRVKIEKLQEMVLKGQRLPQVPAPAPLPPRVPEPAPAAPLPYPAPEASGPPSVVPRRMPPLPPPVPAGRLATPFTAAMGSGQALPYPVAQCPPLPPEGASLPSRASPRSSLCHHRTRQRCPRDPRPGCPRTSQASSSSERPLSSPGGSLAACRPGLHTHRWRLWAPAALPGSLVPRAGRPAGFRAVGQWR